MVSFAFKFDMTFVDDTFALVANVFPHACGSFSSVAIATQRSASVSQKTDIGQNGFAGLASEAIRMPAVVHCFYNASDDEFALKRSIVSHGQWIFEEKKSKRQSLRCFCSLPHFAQHGAKSTWKSCSQYLRFSNS